MEPTVCPECAGADPAHCITCTWQPFADRYTALVAALRELTAAAQDAAGTRPPGTPWYPEVHGVWHGLAGALIIIEDCGAALEAVIGSELHIQAALPLQEVAA